MKAYIFDLDGTIVLSHPLHYEAYQKILADFKSSITYKEFNEELVGTGAANVLRTGIARAGVDVLKKSNIKELVIKKRHAFSSLLMRHSLKAVPGFFEFMMMLDAKKAKRAIASAADHESITAMLTAIDALHFFPIRRSGEDVKNQKPAPDIFLAAAQALDEEPSNCIVFEDTEHGIRGAVAAGMHVIGITTTLSAERLLNAGAYAVFANYSDLLKAHNVL